MQLGSEQGASKCPNVCLFNFMDLMDSNFMAPMCVSPTLRLVGNYFWSNCPLSGADNLVQQCTAGLADAAARFCSKLERPPCPPRPPLETPSYNWRHRPPLETPPSATIGDTVGHRILYIVSALPLPPSQKTPGKVSGQNWTIFDKLLFGN